MIWVQVTGELEFPGLIVWWIYFLVVEYCCWMVINWSSDDIGVVGVEWNMT